MLIDDNNTIYILDHETFGRGDLAWDIAGIVQSILALAAIASDQVDGDDNVSLYSLEACFNAVNSALPALALDWNDVTLVSRVQTYSSLRLIQTAMEYATTSSAIPLVSGRLLQAAYNLEGRMKWPT